MHTRGFSKERLLVFFSPWWLLESLDFLTKCWIIWVARFWLSIVLVITMSIYRWESLQRTNNEQTPTSCFWRHQMAACSTLLNLFLCSCFQSCQNFRGQNCIFQRKSGGVFFAGSSYGSGGFHFYFLWIISLVYKYHSYQPYSCSHFYFHSSW